MEEREFWSLSSWGRPGAWSLRAQGPREVGDQSRSHRKRGPVKGLAPLGKEAEEAELPLHPQTSAPLRIRTGNRDGSGTHTARDWLGCQRRWRLARGVIPLSPRTQLSTSRGALALHGAPQALGGGDEQGEQEGDTDPLQDEHANPRSRAPEESRPERASSTGRGRDKDKRGRRAWRRRRGTAGTALSQAGLAEASHSGRHPWARRSPARAERTQAERPARAGQGHAPSPGAFCAHQPRPCLPPQELLPMSCSRVAPLPALVQRGKPWVWG